MKKPIITMALLAITLSIAKAQIKDTIGMNIPVVDNRIIYAAIVDVPNKSKDELYHNVKLWFDDYFKSSKDVIQDDDKESGTIVGKGIIFYQSSAGLGITMTYMDRLTIKVICKDNKYKYEFYDMVSLPPNGDDDYAINMDNFEGKLLGTAKASGSKSGAKKMIMGNDISVRKMIYSLYTVMNSKPDNF